MSHQCPDSRSRLTPLRYALLGICLMGFLTACQHNPERPVPTPVPPPVAIEAPAPVAAAPAPPEKLPDNVVLIDPVKPSPSPPAKKKGKPKKAAKKSAMAGASLDLPLSTPLPADDEIPQFDWPPPKASAQESIPDKWLRTGTAPTLSEVADKFEKAIKLAGYRERSYYSVPNGFALATQLEHIQADGTPLPGDDRWTVGTPRVGNLSLLAFIKALAGAPPGVYRVIIFVVTDAPWKQSPNAPGEQQVMDWPGGGATSLPASIGKLPFGEHYRAEALVYEFRKGQSGPAETVLPSQVSGETHLTKGGLWRLLSLL